MDFCHVRKFIQKNICTLNVDLLILNGFVK
jgi:hypothetical protein